MTPDELTPSAAATPEPSPAPSAPEPSPAPSPPPEPSPPPSTPSASEDRGVNVDMWKSMLSQTGGPEAERSVLESATRPATRPRETAPERQTAPAQPAPPAPKQWAGKYQTPDALESAHTELQRIYDRTEAERVRAIEHAERVERLLQASMQRPAPAPPPPGADPAQWQQQQAQERARAAQPAGLQQALKAIQLEGERIALGDPQADPLRLVQAIAVASRLDEQSRRYYGDLAVTEYQQQAQVEGALQSIQNKFFETYPDLRSARPSLLRQVAIETEDALRQTRRDYGSPQYMQSWFEETAKQARASIRTGDGAVSAPSGSTPARSQASAPARTRGAPFAETPTPRSQEPVLDGQALHLARVFGRGA